jgi:tetratricopeptide (TPR) repeat protein
MSQSAQSGGMSRPRLKALRGKLLRRSGQREEARAELLAVIDELNVGDNFARAEPAELAAWCHNELSELAGALGDKTGRLAQLERSLAIREGRFAADPSSRGARQQLIISLSNLGGTQVQFEEFSAAMPLLQRAAELGEQLIEAFPGLPEYRFNLSGVLINLGAVCDRLDDNERARACLERSCEIMTRLLEAEPQRAEYRAHLIAASSNLVAMELQQGHYGPTIERLDPFDAALAELLQQSPGERNLLRTQQFNTLNRIRAHWGLHQAAAATTAAARLLDCEDPKILCNAAKELGAVLDLDMLSQAEREDATETVLDLLEAAKRRGAEMADIMKLSQMMPLQDHPRIRALVQ